MTLASLADIIIDKEDEHFLVEYNWANDGKNYFCTRKENKTLLLHRLIMNAIDGQVIDHKIEIN